MQNENEDMEELDSHTAVYDTTSPENSLGLLLKNKHMLHI